MTFKHVLKSPGNDDGVVHVDDDGDGEHGVAQPLHGGRHLAVDDGTARA